METVPHTDLAEQKFSLLLLCHTNIPQECFFRKKSLNDTYLLTLYVWQVFLVLVYLAAKNGEGESLEEHGALLQLRLSVSKQIEGAALGHSHSC